MIWAISLTALLLGLASPADAGTRWSVASNGTDSATCGGKKDPCRTITSAMANAADGDVIEVGPGRYGDLNGNGTLGEAEEESPSACACAVHVTKSLLLRSRAGSALTVIEAGGAALGVRMDSSDGTVGEPGRGFTLRGADSTAFEMRGSRNRAAGNLATQNGDFGFRVAGSDTVLEANDAVGNDAGFFVSTGLRASLLGNRSIGNETGFLVLQPAMLVGNVASGNTEDGFHLANPGHQFLDNAAHGNGGVGLFVQFGGSADAIMGNSFVANREAGVRLIEPVDGFSDNNIFGNDPAGNCGLLNESDEAVAAADNFWGAPSGPGGNPADAVCNLGASTTSVTPVATKEVKIKLPKK